jgi:hypothetical protein
MGTTALTCPPKCRFAANQVGNPMPSRGWKRRKSPTETTPRTVEEFLAWCRAVEAELRAALLDSPHLANDYLESPGTYYSGRAEGYALALLPISVAQTLRSQGQCATVRDALMLITSCAEACEGHLQPGPSPVIAPRLDPPHQQGTAPHDGLGGAHPEDGQPERPLLLKHLLEYYAARGDGPNWSDLVTTRHSSRRPPVEGPLSEAALAVENDLHHLAIIDLAADMGCCQRGEFSYRTARGLKHKYCRVARVNGTTADQTPLAEIEQFVHTLAGTPSPQVVSAVPPQQPPGVTPPPAGDDGPPTFPPSERQLNILQAMLEMGATSFDERVTTEQIVAKAEPPGTDAGLLKESIADLKRRRLIDTKKGNGGGCWLQPEGVRLVEGRLEK